MKIDRGLLVADQWTSTIVMCLVGFGIVSGPTQSRAEWWKVHSPKDFEDCSVGADKPGLDKDARAEIIASCDSKFTARRKAGGGYTYFDFMQNRSFDIAGPNPTQEELRRIDQEYLGYLEEQRKTAILAAFTQQQQLPQSAMPRQPPQMSLKQTPLPPMRPKQVQQHANLEKPDLASKSTMVLRPPADLVRVRKDKACGDGALSCGWTKLTTTVSNLRQTLLTPPSRANLRAE